MNATQPDHYISTEPSPDETSSQFTFDPTNGDFLVDVVTAVSTVAGVEPTELSPPLAEVVDPDALAAVVRSGGYGTQVTFRLDEYVVSVTGDGLIDVYTV